MAESKVNRLVVTEVRHHSDDGIKAHQITAPYGYRVVSSYINPAEDSSPSNGGFTPHFMLPTKTTNVVTETPSSVFNSVYFKYEVTNELGAEVFFMVVCERSDEPDVSIYLGYNEV